MTPNPQRTTWCDDPFSEAVQPGKCPECGAALRIRAGANYCWFCERDVDVPDRTFSPVSSKAKAEERPQIRSDPDSRIGDLLNEKPPLVKGSIVFDEEDEPADPAEGDGGAEDQSAAQDDAGSESSAEDDGEFELEDIQPNDDADGSPIGDGNVPARPRIALDDDEGSDFEIVDPMTDDDGEEVTAKAPPRKADVRAEDDSEDEAPQPEGLGEVEEEWGADEDLVEDGESASEEATPAKDDEGPGSSDDDGGNGGDEFVLDDDDGEEEDLEEIESPYARGMKKKMVNVL